MSISLYLYEPDDELSQKITYLLEFMLSDANYGHDDQQDRLIVESKSKSLSVKEVSNLPPVMKLTSDWRQVACALKKCSSHLKVNESLTHVKVEARPPRLGLQNPPNIIAAVNVPAPYNATPLGIYSLFSGMGKVVWIKRTTELSSSEQK